MRDLYKLFFLLCFDGGTEGKEGQLHELEGLEPHGDADDGDAADHAGDQIPECHLPARKDGPDEIGYGVLVEFDDDPFPEGGEGQPGGLEALTAQGDTDDGDAEKEPQNCPAKPQPQTAEEKPNDVCDKLHGKPPK